MPFNKNRTVKAVERRSKKQARRALIRQVTQPPVTNQTLAKQMCFYFRRQAEMILATMPVPDRKYDPGVYDVRMMDIRKQNLFSLLDAVAMIDALSRNTFQYGDKNRAHWTGFVKDHCGWGGGDLVSVAVLLKRIEHRLIDTKRSQFPPLKVPIVKDLVEHLLSIEKKHVDRGVEVPSCTIDPHVSKLVKFKTLKPVAQLIDSTQLVHVLYDLRNSRLHAMRNLGDASDSQLTITDQPVYLPSQRSRNNKRERTELHLAFHQNFVASLVSAGIDSLEAHLLANGINPYGLLPDNNAWELQSFTPLKQ